MEFVKQSHVVRRLLASCMIEPLEQRRLFTVLTSFDPIAVSVNGRAIADGGAIDFGHTPLATPGGTVTITLNNTSNTDAAVDIEPTPDTNATGGVYTPFEIGGGSSFSGTVAANSSASFAVQFNAPDSNDAAATQSLVTSIFTINVTSSDPNIAPSQATFDATGTLLYPSPAITHKAAYTFTDAAGGTAKFKLTGAGSAVLNFAGQPNMTGVAADPATLTLSGTNKATRISIAAHDAMTLGDVTADGAINSFTATGTTLTGEWSINGGVGAISVAAINSTWTGDISGRLGRLTVSGVAQGSLAAASIGAIKAGSMSGALYLAGDSFGADGLVGGGDDTGGAGSIGSLTVFGSISASTIAAGLDPVDGTLFNGNDVLTGTAKSSAVGPIVIRGTVASNSKLLGVHFSSIRIGGKKVSPAGDPRFSLTLQD